MNAFSPGAMRGRKYGYANRWGELVIDPQFDHAEPFDRGLARVNVGGWRDIPPGTFAGGR